MFIRIFKREDQAEYLINTSHISLLKVTYGMPGDDGIVRKVPLITGAQDPEAIRVYHFTVEGTKFLITSNPDCPVTAVLEDIYNNAAKGGA